MNVTELEGIFTFIKKAENLKNTFRLSYTSTGKQESSAEHSWRLCLVVMLFAHTVPGLNLEKCLKLAVIHDLAEAVCGDIPAIYTTSQGAYQDKAALEADALQSITQSLPDSLKLEIRALWEEYEAASTEEARFVKALDKLETIMQHNQGQCPPDFNYAFNLTYGIEATSAFPTIAQWRQKVDEETKAQTL